MILFLFDSMSPMFIHIITIFHLVNVNEQTLYIAGIHSMCLDKQDITPFNTMAILENNIIETHLGKFSNSVYDYVSFDVCQNVTRLIEVLAEVLLSKRFLIESEWKPGKYGWNSKDERIILIIAHLDLRMSQLLGDLMISLKASVIFLNSEYSLSGTLGDSAKYSILADTSEWMAKDLLHQVIFFRWKYIGIILLNSSSTQTEIYRDLHDNFLRLLKSDDDGICFVLVTVNIDSNNYDDVLITLRNDRKLRTLMLFGRIPHQVRKIMTNNDGLK